MNNALTELLDESVEDSLEGKYLTFQIASETYAIPIREVMEIIKVQPITAIPELASYMKGIINLRGKIIPVMDVRLRLEKNEKAYDVRTCIIVVNISEFTAGLIVDQVSEDLTMKSDDIEPPPDNISKKSNYISGIGKTSEGVKLIMDCAKLFIGIA